MAGIDDPWDSDSTSDGGVGLSGEDAVLYEHLSTLRDGVTRGSITETTTLAPLYDFQAADVDNVLLENLTGVCRYSLPCQLLLDGELLPPTESLIDHGYHFRLTFNKLLFAPSIRLVCDFLIREEHDPTRAELITAALDWHFNDYQGADSGIRDYCHSSDGAISFTAGPATAEGFNFSPFAGLGKEAWNVVCLLRNFLGEATRHQVRIDFNLGALNESKLAELNKIFTRLPGGKGIELPSIGQPEYAAWGMHSDHVHSQCGGMLKPSELLRGSAKHPMVALPCGDTFATIKEAGVQLAYAATTAHHEAIEAVELWTSVTHQAKLFSVGSFPVLGIRFSKFPRLGSVKDEITFRLPSQMSASLIFQKPMLHVERAFSDLSIGDSDAYSDGSRASQDWEIINRDSPSLPAHIASQDPTSQSDLIAVKGFLVENVSNLPPHDALFQITSESLRFFGDEEALRRHVAYFDVRIKPQTISATYAAQLDTIAELQRSKNARWHGILLNQVHNVLNDINLTQAKHPGGVIPPHVRGHADYWLNSFMHWNAEQLQVIRGIKNVKGGVMIVMGPAGTGKTLLQQALAVYFYMLGFHVLALAPANSNADHLATELKRLADVDASKTDPAARMNTELCFHRLWPGSRDQRKYQDNRDIDDDEEARFDLGSLRELLNGVEEYESQKGTVREHGVVHAVISAADERKLVLSARLRNDSGVPCGDLVNAWDLLRDFIEKYRDTDSTARSELLGNRNSKALNTYRYAYRACKGHIIGRNRFMITTTTTVRSSDMVRDWYEPESTYGCARVGVIVFVDEAAKDLESQCWAGVVCDKWATAVSGLVMFGDDKQLKPTNMCSRGVVTFNAFNERLDIDLPSRLAREGFPVYRLLEQRRMHRTISAFPNREIYHNELRDGPGTTSGLDAKFLGLKQILIDIQADHGIRNSSERLAYKYVADDAKARLHWIEVRGKRIRNPASQSICVHEHVDVFFNKIFPSLLEYFRRVGRALNDSVMVICAYGYALHEYHDRIRALLRRSNLEPSDMPKMMTVDGSQGNEAPIVFFDGSLQRGGKDNVGFMSDVGRTNVAVTRARDVFWIIGGSMSLHRRDRTTPTKSLPLLTKYKRELDAMGHVHHFG